MTHQLLPNIDPHTKAVPLIPVAPVIMVIFVVVIMMVAVPEAVMAMIVRPRLAGARV